MLERENVFNRRAAEFIDALVVVADDADVFIPAGEQRGETVLQRIRVLILVDEHVMELPLIERAHIVKPFQQFHRFQNDVVKVQRVRLVQPFLILSVDL